MKFYRNADIEARAEQRLSELEALLGKPLCPPIPIDHIAEKILGLDFLWESIDELPGEVIYGALDAPSRQIVLNERHRGLFLEKPGLERSTKGHEMGHWDLFIGGKMHSYPTLFEHESLQEPFAFRSFSGGELTVLKALIQTELGREYIQKLSVRADHPDEARSVNRYAAALSMPRALITEEALRTDRTHWRNLYRLAEKFDVTITALKVRLEQLGLLYERDGQLYESRNQAIGQLSMF